MKTLRRAINAVLNKSVGLVNRVTQQARDLAAKAARSPVDNALERAVAELPTADHELLREWQSGLRYWEIAKKRGLSEEVVARSLSRIMADLRMTTMPGDDPPGNDVEAKRDQAA